MKIDKNNTGLSSEYFVAAELYRRGFSVGMTIGNAKSIDLMAEMDGQTVKIQVKGMQSSKSICWNLKREQIVQASDFFYVLVNLNVEDFAQPEFFVLSGQEAYIETKPTNSGRDYIDIGPLRKKGAIYSGNWAKINPGQSNLTKFGEVFSQINAELSQSDLGEMSMEEVNEIVKMVRSGKT